MQQDCEKAFELFKLAASAEEYEAFAMLSRCCWLSEGTPQDFAEAARWAVQASGVMENAYCRRELERMRNSLDCLKGDLFEYHCLKQAAGCGESWAAPFIEKLFADGTMPIGREEADALLQSAEERNPPRRECR